MKLIQIPHVTEEYYCINCEQFLISHDVGKNWKCNICNHYVEIRILTDKLDNSCNRILVEELEINNYILVDREDKFRRILNLKNEDKIIRTAIEQYTTLNLEKGSYVIKLNGGWYH